MVRDEHPLSPAVTIEGDPPVVFTDASLIVVRTFDGELHVYADERLSVADLADALPELAADLVAYTRREPR